jgi:hypothetical protein
LLEKNKNKPKKNVFDRLADESHDKGKENMISKNKSATYI